MKIQGEHIFLRIMTEEDTDNIISWRNNPRVRNNFIYRELFTVETHERWRETEIQSGRVLQFIICRKEDETLVGSVYFRDIDETEKGAEYGIFIGDDEAVGKGYGTETAILAVRYAFTEMGMIKLKLKVFSDNPAAVKSYEKAGFRVQADAEVTCSDGEKKKILLMELDKKRWEEEGKKSGK